MDSYRDLVVWQKAMDLAVQCYSATQSFPTDERFGLTSQIRRSAAAIPANIAEGHGRETAGAFVQHLRIAQGSLKELETHLQLSRRLAFLDLSVCDSRLNECDEIGRMLRGLIRSLQKKVGEPQ